MTTPQRARELAESFRVCANDSSKSEQMQKHLLEVAAICDHYAEIMQAEPVATKLSSDPLDERDGVYFSHVDHQKLITLPVGTQLIIKPEPLK